MNDVERLLSIGSEAPNGDEHDVVALQLTVRDALLIEEQTPAVEPPLELRTRAILGDRAARRVRTRQLRLQLQLRALHRLTSTHFEAQLRVRLADADAQRLSRWRRDRLALRTRACDRSRCGSAAAARMQEPAEKSGATRFNAGAALLAGALPLPLLHMRTGLAAAHIRRTARAHVGTGRSRVALRNLADRVHRRKTEWRLQRGARRVRLTGRGRLCRRTRVLVLL